MLALRRATTRARTGSRRRSATPTTGASCRSATTAPTRATTGTSSRRPGAHRTQPAGSAAYPDGGYFVLRSGEPLRDRPLRRRRAPRPRRPRATTTSSRSSSRAGAAPLVVDPGTYVYTSDPVERNRFRSTAFHATLRVDGAEQNELRTDDLFAMDDRARAEALAWDAVDFEGRHHGFPGATHTRRIELARARAPRSATPSPPPVEQELEWTFPLAPGEEDRSRSRAEGLEFHAEPGWYSPRYGVRSRRRSCGHGGLRRPGEDVTEITHQQSRLSSFRRAPVARARRIRRPQQTRVPGSSQGRTPRVR